MKELSLPNDFEIILANINKNVLIAEMGEYSNHLVKGGVLLISGFYEKDIDDLLACAGKVGFSEATRSERETWACLLLTKK